MLFGDESSESSDNLAMNCPKQECDAEFENILKQEIAIIPWTQIADKFRKCLLTNVKSSTIVEFLDALLTFIRKGSHNRHKDSHKFTKSICNYLFAIKNLASKEAEDDDYYNHMRKVLVMYCILELRLVSVLDDDSMVASGLLLKITSLMQGSNSITVLDVLIDIDEEVRVSRSIDIMKIIYRKYLTKTLIGGPIELEDTNFVKHFIVFHSWYKAENIIEKATVLKLFLSTIKPSQQLRSNPAYAQFLQPYNPQVVGDYKKLLQNSFPRNALVMALRDAERNTNCKNDCGKCDIVDLTLDDQPVIKKEVELSLSLPNEIINVDDDDDDDDGDMEISYLPNLYKRLHDIDVSKERLTRVNVPIHTVRDTVVFIRSDSDEETNEIHEGNNSLTSEGGAEVGCSISVNDLHSPGLSMDDIQPSNSSILKTYSRKKDKKTLNKSNKSIEDCVSLQNRRKTFPVKESMSTETTTIQPILRLRCFTAASLGKLKKVTFNNPPVTKYVFERRDYDDSSSKIPSDPSSSDVTSNYIVTGPQCNFPYVSTGVGRYSSPTLSSETEIKNARNESPKVKTTKKRKKKRIDNNIKQRTSIDGWIKRKSRSFVMGAQSTEKESISIATTNLLSTFKTCSIHLNRCDELAQTNETHPEKEAQLSFDEDMTLKEMIEANEQMLSKNISLKNSEPELVQNELRESTKTIPVSIKINFTSSSAASNDLISRKSVFESTVKSSKVSSQLKYKFKMSKSKSVIRSDGKSVKRMGMTSRRKRSMSAIHLSLNTKSVATTLDVEDHKLKDCFVSVKRLPCIPLETKTKNSKKPHKRPNDQMSKSNSTSDAICRLPTKSPQEYQFKRSFEKVPVTDKSETTQTIEIPSPIISLVTSISSEQFASDGPITKLSQSMQYILDSISASPQLETTLQPTNIVRKVFISQPPEMTEVKSSPSTPLPQAESTTEVNHCETLSRIKMKTVREVTSCSPDTTTSTPQYFITSDMNNSPFCEAIAETENDDHLTHISISNISLEKRLRMTFDDCDNEIPSPVYSPYEGRRKNVRNDKTSKSKIAVNHPSQFEDDIKNVCDAVSPIDLRLKLTNSEYEVDGSEISKSTNTTISSSQPLLNMTDGLNSTSL